MEFKVRLLKFIFLFCLQVSFVDAVTDHQNFLSYLCSFFYKKTDQILSFDELVSFFEEQFTDIPIGDDFDIKIIALRYRCSSYGECLHIAQLIKKIVKENKQSMNMQHFYTALCMDNYKTDLIVEDKRTDLQKLECAYHEAAHAVATIMQDENSEELLFAVSIQRWPNSGGHFITVPLVKDSVGDDLYLFECAVDRFVAGGIGEQIFNVICSDRIITDFDTVDKNNADYDFHDYVTRWSTQDDINICLKAADTMIQIKHNDDFYKATLDELREIVEVSYDKMRQLLLKYKYEIDQLAHLLLEKETVFADEAYAICGKQRPKFYFEQ